MNLKNVYVEHCKALYPLCSWSDYGPASKWTQEGYKPLMRRPNMFWVQQWTNTHAYIELCSVLPVLQDSALSSGKSRLLDEERQSFLLMLQQHVNSWITRTVKAMYCASQPGSNRHARQVTDRTYLFALIHTPQNWRKITGVLYPKICPAMSFTHEDSRATAM